MTREEAINEIKKAMPTMWKETKEAIGVLVPEFAENEDEKIRKHIVEILEKLPGCYWYGQKEKDDSLSYLERQKGQKDYRKLYEDVAQSEWFKENYAGKSLGEEQSPEWSEEDEKLLDSWLDVIDSNDWRMDENFCKASREFINKLKSLHPSWKPSEEQMRALWAVWIGGDTPVMKALGSLLEDLKKLM